MLAVLQQSFNKWLAEFPDHIETSIVHYPGRGSRFNKPPIKEITALVEEIHNAILPILDKPFIFFGHSFGSMLAFELARRLIPSRKFFLSRHAVRRIFPAQIVPFIRCPILSL
jgi:surfactin synthase thioesterase subunit